MKYRVSELTGFMLDAAVARAENWCRVKDLGFSADRGRFCIFSSQAVIEVPQFSEVWECGGYLIDLRRISVMTVFNRDGDWKGEWRAVCHSWAGTKLRHADEHGASPLEAAMRAWVTSKLGDKVDLPKCP